MWYDKVQRNYRCNIFYRFSVDFIILEVQTVEALKIVLTIVQLLLSLFLIATILLQPSKRAGLSGAIAGAADTFLSKNKAKSWDVRLAKITTAVAIFFIIITLALNML